MTLPCILWAARHGWGLWGRAHLAPPLAVYLGANGAAHHEEGAEVTDVLGPSEHVCVCSGERLHPEVQAVSSEVLLWKS